MPCCSRGEQDNEHWSLSHRVLNRARWSSLAASRSLLLLILSPFVAADAPVDISIDETLERRWGGHIRKRGHYRDSHLSSKERAVSSPGLRWMVMAVVVTPRFCAQPWALPFLVVLTTSPSVSESLGKRHKTIAMWAAQMISLLHRWLPNRQIRVLGDSAYNVLELGAHGRKREVSMITPMRLDSVLREPPPPIEQRRKGGKPQVVGPRLPSLEQVLADPETCWQEEEIFWYGQGKRKVQWCSGTALWYRFGSPPLPLRWVLTRDPAGQRDPKALMCTDQSLEVLLIIRTFMKRWSLENTFEEARAHLGIETQRQWSDLAIERSTPLLLGTYSLVALIGNHLAEREPLAAEQTAWYRKISATFHDVLAAVRRQIWNQQVIAASDPDVGLLPHSVSFCSVSLSLTWVARFGTLPSPYLFFSFLRALYPLM